MLFDTQMLRLFSLKTGLALPNDLKLVDLHEILGSGVHFFFSVSHKSSTGDAVLLEYEHASA